MTDLKNKSYAELQAMLAQAEAELAAKKQEARQEAIDEIHRLAASVGLYVEIIDDSNPPTKKKGTVAAKYQNPENPAETWTGRGVRPRWLSEKLSAGAKIEDFAI